MLPTETEINLVRLNPPGREMIIDLPVFPIVYIEIWF